MQEWVLDERKFLTDEEIERLKGNCRTAKEKLIINLGLLAGLRVKEIADLKCGDISLGIATSSLTVRNGKGGKPRLVRFNGELKESIMEYLLLAVSDTFVTLSVNSGALSASYPVVAPAAPRRDCIKMKEVNSEARNGSGVPIISGLNPADPLLSAGPGGHLARRTIQRVFERVAGRAGISGHSFHHLRHTYASHLYRAGGYNLRMVQKQLGHSSIKTTQVYADVFDEDLNQAVEKLYKPR